jgi:hypothetical protein
MEKGMVFGFRKTATAVVGPEIEEETYMVNSLVFARIAFLVSTVNLAFVNTVLGKFTVIIIIY